MVRWLLLTLLLLQGAFAIGVSPAGMNVTLASGEQAVVRLLLSNTIDGPVTVQPSSGWLSFEQVVLPPRAHTYVNATIAVPLGTAAGTYDRTLELRETYGDIVTGTASKVELVTSMHYIVVVETAATISCVIGGFHVSDAEVGDMSHATYSIKNTGTAQFIPQGVLRLAHGETFQEKNVSHELVVPGETRTFAVTGISLAEEGDYDATIDLGCHQAQTGFTVVPRGALGTEGTLTDVEVKALADTVPVRASFANNGSRSLRARLSGVVEKDGEIVGIIETESLLVAPGEDADFESYYAARDDGEYTVRAKVVYEGKQTPEVRRSVTVAKQETFPYWIIATIVLALLVAILVKRTR